MDTRSLMSKSRFFSAITALPLGLLALGCDFGNLDNLVSIPPFGTLVVTTVTTGSNLDPDGYRLAVTGATLNVKRDIELNGRATFSVVRGGDCTVELADVAANCSADANPQLAQVVVGSVETVTFNVSCV